MAMVGMELQSDWGEIGGGDGLCSGGEGADDRRMRLKLIPTVTRLAHQTEIVGVHARQGAWRRRLSRILEEEEIEFSFYLFIADLPTSLTSML